MPGDGTSRWKRRSGELMSDERSDSESEDISEQGCEQGSENASVQETEDEKRAAAAGGASRVTVIPRNTHEKVGNGGAPVDIDLATVTSMFEMRLADAARSLGVSKTSFKQACRKLGIQRWPRRMRARPKEQPVWSQAGPNFSRADGGMPSSSVEPPWGGGIGGRGMSTPTWQLEQTPNIGKSSSRNRNAGNQIWRRLGPSQIELLDEALASTQGQSEHSASLPPPSESCIPSRAAGFLTRTENSITVSQKSHGQHHTEIAESGATSVSMMGKVMGVLMNEDKADMDTTHAKTIVEDFFKNGGPPAAQQQHAGESSAHRQAVSVRTSTEFQQYKRSRIQSKQTTETARSTSPTVLLQAAPIATETVLLQDSQPELISPRESGRDIEQALAYPSLRDLFKSCVFPHPQ